MIAKSGYVLVTPAKNEAAYIGATIESVAAQTVRPTKWVIVSDGSTDATDEIVEAFARRHSWIVLVRRGHGVRRSFSSKVAAFRDGQSQLTDVDHDFIGNLDADVTFQPNYFETVMNRFATSPRLGVAGGLIHELIGEAYVPQSTSLDSVAGAVQLFRRECFESIGGYIPLRFGGIDSAAEITARRHGWEVQTFEDIEVRHHRRVSGGEAGLLKTKLRHGWRHYGLGYHPAFEALRCLYRITDRPYVIGSVLTACGFAWAWITRQPHELPPDVIEFARKEQFDRLHAMFFGQSLRTGRSRS